MFLQPLDINPQTPVSEIVSTHYRSADVFRRHGIEYCCGGRWTLEAACMMKGVDPFELISELQRVCRTVQLPGDFPFEKWSLEFLADYIVHVHHYYLQKTLPELEPALNHFIEEHQKKYPHLAELHTGFEIFHKEIIPHLKEEEEIIFPYIRQVARAWRNNDSYGGLLVRTLRKPINTVMDQEHKILSGLILKWRELTNHYNPPEKACVSHRVIFAKLKELDNDLVQHMHLENDILFPQAMQIEKELLRLS